jgi:hypothetical protein
MYRIWMIISCIFLKPLKCRKFYTTVRHVAYNALDVAYLKAFNFDDTCGESYLIE